MFASWEKEKKQEIKKKMALWIFIGSITAACELPIQT